MEDTLDQRKDGATQGAQSQHQKWPTGSERFGQQQEHGHAYQQTGTERDELPERSRTRRQDAGSSTDNRYGRDDQEKDHGTGC